MSAIPHLGYIVAAYGVAGVSLAVMIGVVWLDYRSLSAQLEALDRSRGGKS
jgi:heme exporter protein CcmD